MESNKYTFVFPDNLLFIDMGTALYSILNFLLQLIRIAGKCPENRHLKTEGTSIHYSCMMCISDFKFIDMIDMIS
jgi:hypothetical protein